MAPWSASIIKQKTITFEIPVTNIPLKMVNTKEWEKMLIAFYIHTAFHNVLRSSLQYYVT